MKNYGKTTWADLNKSGYISPVKGIGAANTAQVAAYLNRDAKELAKARGRAKDELRSLGMFTASAKKLLAQIPEAKRTSAYDYIFPLEDGGTLKVSNGPIVYYTPGAIARLADELEREANPVTENEPDSAVPNEDHEDGFQSIHSIECYEKDGVTYLKLEDVARRLGLTHTETKNGVKYTSIKWATIAHLLREVGFQEKLAKNGYIPENVFYRLMMKVKNATEQKFQGQIANELAPAPGRRATVNESSTTDTSAGILNIGGVECYEKDGVAYLKLETVARGLGFTDTSKGVEYVRWNTVRQYLGEIGFSQAIAKDGYVPENVFYRLAMKANNATANAFQAKIANEVLPSIRKHGLYATYDKITQLMSQPETIIQIFTKIKEEQEKNRTLEQRVCTLEEINDDLQQENRMLAKQEQTWDSRQIVSRLVRLYSHYVCGGDFQQGWRNFYRELNYRHHINLCSRPGEVAIIDRVHPEEWGTLVSVAASMCVSNNIDLNWAVNQTNAAAIADGGVQ